MTTYYVMHSRDRIIVNVVEATDRTAAGKVFNGMKNPEKYELTENPPEAALSAYKYWNTRP